MVMSVSHKVYKKVTESKSTGIKADSIAKELNVDIDSVSGILSRFKQQNKIYNQENLWRRIIKTSMSPSIMENIKLVEDKIADIHDSGDIGTGVIPSEIYMRAMEKLRFLRQLSLYLNRFYNSQF